MQHSPAAVPKRVCHAGRAGQFIQATDNNRLKKNSMSDLMGLMQTGKKKEKKKSSLASSTKQLCTKRPELMYYYEFSWRLFDILVNMPPL